MELITSDVEAFHFCFGDSYASLVGAGVEQAFNLETGLGGRRPISSTTARRNVSGRPR